MHASERATAADPSAAREKQKPPLDIVIPLYKSAGLVEALLASLHAAAPELERLRCSITAINDSPRDPDLEACLPAALRLLSEAAPCELITNPGNLGFVASVNLGLRRAVERKHDVIVLNSDTVVTPGAFSELQRVAYLDPMTGFVSPRSNNASLCSLPLQKDLRNAGQAESYQRFLKLSRFLPDFHFVPTPVGFCLYIKLEILEEFGFFDEAYGKGYDEENDLAMRANRCGYRSALANHAWVYHVGGASFAQTPEGRAHQKQNIALLNSRYPEFKAHVDRYESGPHYEAELLLAGLWPDPQGRLDFLFDFSSVGPYHNGTFTAAKEILARAVRLWPQFNLYVMASEKAWDYHQLRELDRVRRVDLDTTARFAAALRFGQPFDAGQMIRLSSAAAVNVYAMLDPIALDCLYLNGPDLETLWRAVFEHADGVIYISDFVSEQFRRRFRLRPGLRELVSYLSLDCGDYRAGVPASGGHILVIGNHFDHKRVAPTVEALSRAFPDEKIAVIGVSGFRCGNVVSYQSGMIDENTMEDLWSGARFTVFPSTYEGFGLPVVESLARQKPILARDLPPVRAIREKMSADRNVILYSSTASLIDRLKRGFPAWEPAPAHRAEGWDYCAAQIGDFLDSTLQAFDFENVLVPRLIHMRLLDHDRPTAFPQRTDQLEAQIAEIRRSWSWRLTSPLRAAGGAFLRLMNR